MVNRAHKTDRAVLAALGERLARHRLNHNLSQAQLAREAGVSQRTLVRLEAGESTQMTSFIRVLRALGLLEFLDTLAPDEGPSPLELLQSERKQRQRASRRSSVSEPPEEEWTWAESDDTDEDAP